MSIMGMRKKEKGFTLIELLLVVVIIGILLAVIVPRAWRANVDSKYGLVRQNATELASFASQWAEQMMEAQDLASESRLIAYYNSLTMASGTAENDIEPDITWIGVATTNWRATGVDIEGRLIGGDDDAETPEASVESLVPPERLQRNPFTGTSVFRDLPTADLVIPGALACGTEEDDGYAYFALVFQGTGSEASVTPDGDSLHAGMSETLAGLRNGIFMARMAPN